MTVNIPINIVSIDEDGFHLLIEIEINHKKANMLIDTGASRTVFDEGIIREYLKTEDVEFEENVTLSSGIGTNTMKSKAVNLDLLKFDTLEIENYHALVLDLRHVNESYKMLKLPVIHGILGGDLLKKLKAVIYYKTKTLKLYS